MIFYEEGRTTSQRVLKVIESNLNGETNVIEILVTKIYAVIFDKYRQPLFFKNKRQKERKQLPPSDDSVV
jgi:hypothetical protein